MTSSEEPVSHRELASSLDLERGPGQHSRGMGVLREVVEADLPVFHEHERDPEASAMAAESSGAAGSRRRPSPSSSTSSVRVRCTQRS